MTSEELITNLLSDEGLRYSIGRLKKHPNANYINLIAIYNNLTSVIRSFTEEIKTQPMFPLGKSIQDQRVVEMTTCECKDDVDFIVNALDVMLLQDDSTTQLILKGLSESGSTPFEVYTFTKMEDGTNYYLSHLCQLDFKLINTRAFSPVGYHVFDIPTEGNAMINTKARYPRFEGMRGDCKQQLAPIKVYTETRGKEDEQS